MRTWDIYPAIDLRRGRVVRLRQGDPNLETKYADDPLDVARRWQEAGSAWVHVVNLDGAFGEHSQANQAALERILTTGLQVQFGGGVRDFKALCRALDLGVSRVVVGTAAVKNPALVEAALEAFGPERVAVGIDAREGKVHTHGWEEGSTLTAVELAQQWAVRGIHWVVFTDVTRDGMGSGLNLEATVQLAQVTGPSTALRPFDFALRPFDGAQGRLCSGQAQEGQRSPRLRSGQAGQGSGRRLHVIASGGVANLGDVRRAYHAGLSGVIIGRALYEGQVTLEDALRVETAKA